MQYKKFGTSYVIRLEIEDELIGSLNEFAIKEKITGGFFYGLGAVKGVSLGYFEVEKKKYKEKTYDMDYELTSLVGDISLFENNVMVHAHVTLADKYFRVLAGHCYRAVVTATVEIFFNPIEGKLEKKIDPDSGLNLLDLKG